MRGQRRSWGGGSNNLGALPLLEMVKRICVALPDEVSEELDKLMEELGLDNRSKVVSNAILSYVSSMRWIRGRGEVAGSITIVYEHSRGDVVKKLVHVQHEHLDVIKSSVHIHLDEDRCLEVLGVVGDVEEIKRLLSELGRTSGILGLSVTAFPMERSGSE